MRVLVPVRQQANKTELVLVLVLQMKSVNGLPMAQEMERVMVIVMHESAESLYDLFYFFGYVFDGCLCVC